MTLILRRFTPVVNSFSKLFFPFVVVVFFSFLIQQSASGGETVMMFKRDNP